MGGRVAEELTQDDITTGAGNDIERATDLARQMVCEWGMSVARAALVRRQRRAGLPRPRLPEPRRVQRGDRDAHRRRGRADRLRAATCARPTILTQYRAVLDHVASELLEREVLDGDEVYDIIREMTGRELKPMRVRIREAKDRETRGKSQAAAARVKRGAKIAGRLVRAASAPAIARPTATRAPPSRRRHRVSAFPPQPHPTTDEA